MIYKTEYYHWHGDAASAHNLTALEEMLNERAEAGWFLHSMFKISIGLMLIFARNDNLQ